MKDNKSTLPHFMKYLAKTFIEAIPDWTTEELVFNAIAWWKGYRFFGCSHDLSHVVKGTKKDHGKFTWLRTSLTGCNLTYDVDMVVRENSTL